MSITALDGPLIVNGQLQTAGSYNPDLGPSVFWAGMAILDPRSGYDFGGGGGSINVTAWGATGDLMVIDYAPSTLSTTAIAAAQTPTAGTKLTLVSSTGSGITVVSTATQVFPSGNVIPVGTLAIDGLPGLVSMGQTGAIALYDPTKMAARNVQIASVGNDSTATFTVRGYDVYGYAMSETITGANAGTAAGKKAFKFVSSITPAGTLSGSNVSAGQGDTYGFPLRTDSFAYVYIVWANSAVTSSATGTFTYADTTNPATSTTGDVRGTWKTNSASNGTNVLQVLAIPKIANLNSATGLFGVTPA